MLAIFGATACGGTVNGATVTPELNQLMYVINQKPDLEAVICPLMNCANPSKKFTIPGTCLSKPYHTPPACLSPLLLVTALPSSPVLPLLTSCATNRRLVVQPDCSA